MQPYAIVHTGGKQYKVNSGDVIRIEKIQGMKEGDGVELPILASHDGEAFQVGTPELEAKATGTVIAQERGKKVIVFKKKRRTTYRKKNGHRQDVMAVRIDSIPGS